MSSIRTKLSNRQTVMFKKEKDLVCTVTFQYRQNSNKTFWLLWNKAIFRIYQYICFFLLLFFLIRLQKSRLLYSIIYCLCHSDTLKPTWNWLCVIKSWVFSTGPWKCQFPEQKERIWYDFQKKGTLGIGLAVCDTVGVT